VYKAGYQMIVSLRAASTKYTFPGQGGEVTWGQHRLSSPSLHCFIRYPLEWTLCWKAILVPSRCQNCKFSTVVIESELCYSMSHVAHGFQSQGAGATNVSCMCRNTVKASVRLVLKGEVRACKAGAPHRRSRWLLETTAQERLSLA
jgi:hypothetical protein